MDRRGTWGLGSFLGIAWLGLAVGCGGDSVPAGTADAGAPRMEVTPTALDFGSPVIGDRAERTVTVTNVGTGVLEIRRLEVIEEGPGGEYSAAPVGDVSIALLAGEWTTIQVTLTALDEFADIGTLRIRSNDIARDPVDVALTGRAPGAPALRACVVAGADACLDCAVPTALAMTSAAPGNYADLALSNGGGGTVLVRGVFLGASAWAGMFSVELLERTAAGERPAALPFALPAEPPCGIVLLARVTYTGSPNACIPTQVLSLNTDDPVGVADVPILVSTPSTPEQCDGADNDCNGATDEGCNDDGDAYCDAAMVTVGAPSACTGGGGDCNDMDATIYPTSTEQCDGVDNNCDMALDEGCDDDMDGYCDAAMVTVGSPAACAMGGGDCNDGDGTINPDACLASGDGMCLEGICDVTTSTCGTRARPGGTTCEDGDLCTLGDRCVGSVCTSTSVETCASARDTCHDATCNSATGLCDVTTFMDGTVCDDGSSCTVVDRCMTGTCQPGAVDCTGMDSACTVGRCDATAGRCVADPVPDGSACPDGDADPCTVGACVVGACQTSRDASGAGLFFDGACPPGYTELAAYRDRYLRGDDGNGVYGETGGAVDHVHDLATHGHTAAVRRHEHDVRTGRVVETGERIGSGSIRVANDAHLHRYPLALGGSHGHTMAGGAETLPVAANLPAFREVALCEAPSGTTVVPPRAMALFDSACPTGWTEETGAASRMLRGHDGDAVAGETAGSDSHSHAASHTHALDPFTGSHTHTLGRQGSANLLAAGGSYAASPSAHGHGVSWCSVDFTHGHTAQATTSVFTSTPLPAWREHVLCRKDTTSRGAAIPTGVRLVWPSGPCPACWQVDVTAQGRLLRGSNGDAVHGETGGAATHDHAGAHGHGSTSEGRHDHCPPGCCTTGPASGGTVSVGGTPGTFVFYAGPTGHTHSAGTQDSTGQHTHSLASGGPAATTSGAGLPPYREVTVCTPSP